MRFVPGETPALQIHAQFTLVNSGTTDLPYIDATFPDEKAFGRENLRVEVDGREVAPANLPEEYQQELPNALRLAFDPPWKQKQAHELAINYTLRSPGDSSSRITVDSVGFHLGSRGWFPVPRPPKHLLSPFPARPDKTEYSIRVPAGFVVLARGTPAGKKNDGGEVEYRFRLRAGDLAPYVVAGRYTASGDERKSGGAVFWTLQPLKENPSAAAERITAAWTTLVTAFGPPDKNIRVPHVVESPGLRSHVEQAGEGPATASFPGGVLVNPGALALGVNSNEFVEMVTHGLAHNWFGDEIYPSPDAALGMGEGLPEYAAIVVDEALQGEAARRERILHYLHEYDAAAQAGAEKPLAVTMLHDPPAQRAIALAKAPLFFAALEDACGADAMRSGLAQMVTLLRGQEAGYDDLRVALEKASGKNLGELFRVWLNQKGIPADFRARYQDQPGGSRQGK